jgi:threonine dehydrogenase-like Zn-dependent dehydrogenase
MIIRMTAAAICGTDIRIFRGPEAEGCAQPLDPRA